MPAIKTIFLANLAEIALPLVRLMKLTRGVDEVYEDHVLCDRFLFDEDDDRVLVTPYPIEPEFFQDTTALLRFKNIINWWPKKLSESLCQSVLADKDLAAKLEKIIAANPGVNLVSYAATLEFYQLTTELQKKGLKFTTPEAPAEADRWVQDFFDSKAGFRQAMAAMLPGFPAMPEGAICGSTEEIVGWAKTLLEKYGGCVLKTNRGLAGAGLKIIRQKDVAGKSVEAFLRQFLAKEKFWRDFPIVVERFLPPDMTVCGGAPNIELRVRDGVVEPLYVCSMRMTPEGVFLGVESGKGAVPNNLAKMLELTGLEFGKLLKDLGYRGNFETDWVYGVDGVARPIEANLRRTGGTHVYEMTRRLLGPEGIGHSYQVSINIHPAKKFRSYKAIKKAARKLFFPIQEKPEGVVVTIVNSLSKGNIGYVVIASDKKRALEIEEEFLQVIN